MDTAFMTCRYVLLQQVMPYHTWSSVKRTAAHAVWGDPIRMWDAIAPTVVTERAMAAHTAKRGTRITAAHASCRPQTARMKADE